MHFFMILLLAGLSFKAVAQNCESTSILSETIEKNAKNINDVILSDLYSCLEKLSSDNLVNEMYRKNFWKTVNGKKIFLFRCSEDIKESKEVRFAMLSKDDLNTLNYPVYSYQVKFRDGSTDTATLPRNFMRFFQNGKEHIMMEYHNTANLIPRTNLAAVAKEEQTNVAKIESEYFKKYEDFLIKDKGISQIRPVSITPDKIASTAPFFENIIQSFVRQMIDVEARKFIPYFSQINPDLKTIYSSTSEELKANSTLVNKYTPTVAEIKKKITAFFLNRLGGSCSTQIDAGIMDKMLDQFYQEDLKNFETVRQVFTQKAQ